MERTLTTTEAARLLNTTPNTVRSWSRRHGFPAAVERASRHQRWLWREVDALREALEREWSITSAISLARERLAQDDGPYSEGYRAGYRAALERVTAAVADLIK